MMSTAVNFDTHSAVKRLCSTGLNEQQAEAIITAIYKSREIDLSNLVTKDQFALLHQEVIKLDEKIDALENKIDEKIDALEDKFDGKIDALEKTIRTEMHSEINQVKYDLLKWIMPMLATTTIAILGVVIKLFVL